MQASSGLSRRFFSGVGNSAGRAGAFSQQLSLLLKKNVCG